MSEDKDNVIAFAGLMSYVGIERSTNKNGMSMGKCLIIKLITHCALI